MHVHRRVRRVDICVDLGIDVCANMEARPLTSSQLPIRISTRGSMHMSVYTPCTTHVSAPMSAHISARMPTCMPTCVHVCTHVPAQTCRRGVSPGSSQQFTARRHVYTHGTHVSLKMSTDIACVQGCRGVPGPSFSQQHWHCLSAAATASPRHICTHVYTHAHAHVYTHV